MVQQFQFYRSMSLREYRNHEMCKYIDVGQEWAEPTLERDDWGVSLHKLKEWVDQGQSAKGPHDLVIKVAGSVPGEFKIRPRVNPPRYINVVQIPFEKVEVVYDPRVIVSEKPIHTLEMIL